MLSVPYDPKVFPLTRSVEAFDVGQLSSFIIAGGWSGLDVRWEANKMDLKTS